MPSALGALSTAGHHSGEDTVAEDERDMDKHNDGEEEEDEEEEAEAEEGDVEYEEIEEEIEVEEEVEEEIEVEEEVEEEVEVEEESEEEEFEEVEEIEEEELSGSPINEELNEVCQVVESKGHEVLPESDYSVREKCVANPPSDILPVGGIGNSKSFDTSERRDKGESTTDVDSPKCQRGEKYLVVPEDGRFQVSTCDEKESISFPERGTPSHDDACKNINTSLCDSRIMPAETSEQLIVSVEEATAAIPAGGVGKETNIAGCPEAEIGKTDAQSREEGMHQGPTSLIVPQIRPRSLSPVSEFNDGNKRPAVICNFFAKGWCIKGNSCRFLHIKDNVNSTTQKHEGDVTTLGLQADGGLGGGTDRPKSAYFLNTSTPSVTCSSSLSLERTPSVEHGESPRWNPSSKDCDNLSDNNFQGKDLFTSQEKAVRTSHTDQKNGIIFPQEEKSLSPFHVKDASNLDSDPGNQKDGQRQKKESKINVFGQDHEIGFDLKIDGERKESKALKHFRAALIEFVKEFVKPAWREGLISKDAHKIIVKKAVHKVLSTLQPRQTPNTPELIKQYLSASEPKISKLVEGYVVKYGKP
ncbi:hypothetical protein NMG60_11014858 [Bertholletia excelsa]